MGARSVCAFVFHSSSSPSRLVERRRANDVFVHTPPPPPTQEEQPTPEPPAAMATLASLQARLDALQCDYDELSATLGQPLPPAAALKDAGARIPVLDGHAALLQTRV